MKVEGGCHCGNITFEADVDPETAAICHCTDCQMLTGSAYRANVRTNKGAFKLLSGKPKVYVKIAESGTKRSHAFCPDCGTPVYSTSVTDPQFYSLRFGTLRQRAQLRPIKQIWCGSAQSWAMDLGGIPQTAKQ